MDFDLSADQVALRDGARDLLDGYAGPAQVRAHLATGRPYDETLWAAMVEQGWLAVAVPEESGGLGLGWVEAAVLLTETGRHVAPVPLTPTLVALAALVGRPEHADRVEAMVGGASIGAVAWSADPTALVVGGEGDGLHLSGRLGPVEAASVADVVVVVVPDGVYLVEQPAQGRPTAEPAMDLTRSLSWLDLDHTAAVRLGGPAEAERLTSLGAVAASAELLGGCDRILEMSTEYAKDRVQFGAPIGSFQAVKHRCADMLVDVEGMRSVTWYGAWAWRGARPGRGDGGLDGQGLVRRRLEAGDGLGAAGSRRDRLHLGARPAPLPEAGPGGAARLRRRVVPPASPGHRVAGQGPRRPRRDVIPPSRVGPLRVGRLRAVAGQAAKK